jgi:hypothetical protein
MESHYLWGTHMRGCGSLRVWWEGETEEGEENSQDSLNRIAYLTTFVAVTLMTAHACHAPLSPTRTHILPTVRHHQWFVYRQSGIQQVCDVSSQNQTVDLSVTPHHHNLCQSRSPTTPSHEVARAIYHCLPTLCIVSALDLHPHQDFRGEIRHSSSHLPLYPNTLP